MKVLLIDVNCKYSSTGKIVYDLYTDLNQHGHTAAICYGRGPLVKEPETNRFSSGIETCAHAFLTRVTGLTGIYSPVSTRRLLRFMDRFKPDVVHIHELHAYFVNLAPVMRYLKKNHIKTVWTFHCEFMYTGKCGYALDCERWKDACGKCPQVGNYPASLLFDFTRKMLRDKKRMFEGFDNLTIATPSRWLADRVRQSFLKDKDIRVVPNGIDTEKVFFPRSFGHLKIKHNLTDEKVVLAVASNLMSEMKGGQWVLQLAKGLQGQNFKFILIGVGEPVQNLADNLIVLERTSNQIELAEYYSMADFTLLTSKKETFSLVCAESLACGTPIIGFESGAPSEIVPRGDGVFVPYGDIGALEKEVLRFYENPLKDRNRLEIADRAKSAFSNSMMAKKYRELYFQ